MAYPRCCTCIHHGWLLILLTTCLLLLTTLQASGSVLTRNFHLVNQSRSYSIFFLRTFSELSGLALAATLSATLERLKWAMVMLSGAKGGRGARTALGFVEFLALDEATTGLGLLKLLFSPSVSSFRAKMCSLARLALMIVVPVTGILIMSRVDVQPAFSPVSMASPYSGYGLQPMNASTALEYFGFTDIIFGSKFSAFLSGPSRSVDLTPESQREKPCGLNVGGADRSGCHREYFFPGDAMYIMPEILTDPRYPDAPVFFADDHRGLYLEFDAGDLNIVFNSTTDCRVYSGRYMGYQIGAVRLCVVNKDSNVLYAGLVKCPGEISIQQQCLTNLTWHQDPSWLIKMSTSFQYASVAYSRMNSSILWHSFNTSRPSTPAAVLSTDILKAYDSLLFDTTTLLHQNNTPLPLFSGSSFPTMLWLSIPDFTEDNANNPEVASTLFSVMQSLLSMPLYYCQTGMLRRLVPGLTYGDVSLNEAVSDFLSPVPPRLTHVSFAYQRFETVANSATLIAYVAVSGAAVLFCIVVRVAVGILAVQRRGYERMPDLSSFGAVNLFTHCTVEHGEQRVVVYQGQPDAVAKFEQNSVLLGWLSSLGIRWTGSRRSMDEEEMQSFNWTWNHGGHAGGRYGAPGNGSSSPSLQTLQPHVQSPEIPLAGHGGPKRGPYWGVAI
ncbi:hypothetical protein B0T19DRAFT_198525 [Cercophora scortea]|uniref:Uncharacterized protein n=1 Tax=Cercophora scortea TaxID=314031 RepID=A0AAE0M890_9PEZI|nr:hypothetical protein B0T19DRAFT_198525 [Cercophora scortea]